MVSSKVNNEKYKLEYLSRYYPDIPFLNFYGRMIPVFLITSNYSLINSWKIMRADQILNINDSKFEDNFDNSHSFSDFSYYLPDNSEEGCFDIAKGAFSPPPRDFWISNHQKYKNQKYYNSYKKLVKDTIRYPDRPGFMFKKMNPDALQKGLKEIIVHTGTYAENVYGTHILEYELKEIQKRFPVITDYNWEEIKKFSVIRNSFGDNFLSFPESSNSLLSIQMLVLYKNLNQENYRIALIKRSQNVSTDRGKYQLIPSGGFEVFKDKECSTYTKDDFLNSYHLGLAIFKEFLEELFPDSFGESVEYDSSPLEILLNPIVRKIDLMLDNGLAKFHFLGDCLNLESLRHELCFSLVINDFKKLEYKFSKSTEGKLIKGITLDNFKDYDGIINNLCSSSAGLLRLYEMQKGKESMV